MKVVISTQMRENYGTELVPYWKNKGGQIYLMVDLTPAQASQIEEEGIGTIKSLIDNFGPMFEEFVVDYRVVEDNVEVCDPWEPPFILSYEQGQWIARRTEENNEYGYMHPKVAKKTEQYTLLAKGEHGDYQVVYTMVNGDNVTGDQVSDYLNNLK